MTRLSKLTCAAGAIWASLSLIGKALADTAISPGFAYGSDKVRGVNIGGWLVTEPWITPSLYDATNNDAIIDEWTFGQMQDPDTAKAALQAHWDSFYTEADFAAIAAAGLNHVRIPIGYWAFEVGPGEPYITGQLPYLQKAITWATNHGLKVIVDLHGAPGSQNGFDNSGEKLSFPGWHSNSTNVARTDAIIKTIAGMFVGNTNNVPIIAPLNEPAGFDGSAVLSVVQQYWKDSYGNIRYANGATETNTVVLVHDAFMNASYWSGFMAPPSYQGVLMDTHIYQVFNDEELGYTEDEHIDSACAWSTGLKDYTLGVIVGEFAPAVTDCATYVNGRGIGARYDGSYPGSSRIGSCNGWSGSASSFSSSYKANLRKFWEAQVTAYEAGGDGWIQWAWKTEDGTAEDWSYSAGLANGWIPQDPTDRQYPNVCS